MEPGGYSVIAAAITGITGLVGNILTAGAVRRAARGQASEGSSNPWHRWKVFTRFGAFTFLILVSLSYAVWYGTSTRMHIAFPPDNGFVETTEDITGTASHVGAEYVIRVVIYSEPDRVFYPEETPVVPDESGQWITRGVVIGAAEDSSGAFEILLVLAEPSAELGFSAYFARPERFGMDALPAGTITHDRVRVTRR